MKKDIHGSKFTPMIAVDLDGTLAEYNGWKGLDHIGDPVPLMLTRVRQWISEGKTVVIFTSRVTHNSGEDTSKAFEYIYQWLEKHGLGGLDVTGLKRKEFIEFWDDRAIRVQKNTGEVL